VQLHASVTTGKDYTSVGTGLSKCVDKECKTTVFANGQATVDNQTKEVTDKGFEVGVLTSKCTVM
jgi:hypothetical protein